MVRGATVMTLRVRFAPSPSGYLHIGGARTALFNWLWARKTGGTFVLRIEDTDQERSTAESVRIIFDSLRWLGLTWDEGPEVGGKHGPYTQMERLALYREHAERLIGQGKAYRCYCTKEELEEGRKKAEAEKRQYRYPGTCRDKPYDRSRRHVVRFRVPETGFTSWDDLVKGHISTPSGSRPAPRSASSSTRAPAATSRTTLPGATSSASGSPRSSR